MTHMKNLKIIKYPWRLLHKSIMKSLKISNFIHFVVDDVWMIKKTIEKKYVHMICSKIAELYPYTFHQGSMSGKAMSEKPVQLIINL